MNSSRLPRPLMPCIHITTQHQTKLDGPAAHLVEESIGNELLQVVALDGGGVGAMEPTRQK